MLKLSISPIAKKEIITLKARLAELLEMGLARSGEATRLGNMQRKLAKEIARLEALDEPDDEQAATLAAKRVQLAACEAKLERLASNGALVDVEFTIEASSALKQFARAANAATLPSVDAYVATIAGALRSYCNNEAEAVHIARQTPACVSLYTVTAYPWGQFGGGIPQIEQAIDYASAILEGKLDWEFKPVKK